MWDWESFSSSSSYAFFLWVLNLSLQKFVCRYRNARIIIIHPQRMGGGFFSTINAIPTNRHQLPFLPFFRLLNPTQTKPRSIDLSVCLSVCLITNKRPTSQYLSNIQSMRGIYQPGQPFYPFIYLLSEWVRTTRRPIYLRLDFVDRYIYGWNCKYVE